MKSNGKSGKFSSDANANPGVHWSLSGEKGKVISDFGKRIHIKQKGQNGTI